MIDESQIEYLLNGERAEADVLNRPLRQIVSATNDSLSDIQGASATALSTKADKSTQIIAGTGLTGGGTLAANRTLNVSYGTTAGTAAQGNDSRIVNAVPNSRTITAGTGLSGGGNLTANRTLSVKYGTTAGTAAQGNDSRIVNAASKDELTALETKLSEGQTTELAKKADKTITITAGKGLSGGGSLAANRTLSVKYGTTADTAAQGNDSRIVNAVQTSGNQTIAGVKTFSSFPVTPSTAPTANYQVTNKKYVDDSVKGAVASPTMTSNATLNHTDNSIVATGIVSKLGLEVGDVIEVDHDNLRSGYLKPLGQTVGQFYQFATKGNDVYVVNYDYATIMKQTNGEGLFEKIEGITAHPWIGICFIGNQMYAASHGGNIHSVNETTGATTIVNTSYENWYNITTDGTHIYGCVSNSGIIVKIDPITKTQEFLVPTSPYGDVHGLVYSPIDNSLYIGAGGGANPIRKLVNMTGEWIDVSTEKRPWSSASYYKGKVYFSDHDGQVWKENDAGDDFELFSKKPLGGPDGPGGHIIVNDILYKSQHNGDIYTTSIIKKDLFSVESIVSDNIIIVNYAHAFGAGSKSLWSQTLSATKFKRIAKWFNAPVGLGQAWAGGLSRTAGVTYTNDTGRPIQVLVTAYSNSQSNSISVTATIQGVSITATGGSDTGGANKGASLSFIVPTGGTYIFTEGGSLTCVELR